MANRSTRQHRVHPSERFPAKPRKDGRFQKRIRGVLYYFGSYGDREAALAEYERDKRDLYAGRVPRAATASADMTTVYEISNRYLEDKLGEVKSKTLEEETYKQARRALRRFVKFCGKGRVWVDLTPDDFRRYGVHCRKRLGDYAFNRERAAVVGMFNHASEQDWIEHVPKFGNGFRRTPKGKLRGAKVQRLLSSDDVNALLGMASADLFGMILLGINGGFGAKDCALLPWTKVDLARGLIAYKRPKTNIARTVTLWPETVDVLKRLRKSRPHSARVFNTVRGNAWTGNAIAHEFDKLSVRSGLELPAGVGIYACRHTFATYANEIRDTDARRHIRGMLVPNLDDIYVETFFIQRLQGVTDHVRKRLKIAEVIGDRS